MNALNLIDAGVLVRCRGRFRAVVHTGHTYDENGNITRHGIILRETPFGRNKVTLTGFGKTLQDQGNQLAMVVGAGNTAPTESDTVLASYLGKSSTFAAAGNGTTRSTIPDGNGDVYWRMTKRITFNPGTLGGGNVNVAEAGIVTNVPFSSINNATQVNARGLLVDGSGNPTTVAVNNATEYLDVIWEYTEYVKASATGTVTLSIDGVNVVHDYEVRPYCFDNAGGAYNYNGWGAAGTSNWPGFNSPPTGGFASVDDTRAHSGPLVAITGDPWQSAGGTTMTPITTLAAYTPGNKYRDWSCTWLPSNGNVAGGIGAVLVNCRHSQWQMSFSPKIPKDNTKQLDLTFRYSMANK